MDLQFLYGSPLLEGAIILPTEVGGVLNSKRVAKSTQYIPVTSEATVP